MNSIYLFTVYAALCCSLLFSVTGCAQPPVPNDLALARIKGPAKQVVITTYASPGKEEDHRAGFPNRIATHRVVLSVMVGEYNKKGTLTYLEQTYWTQEAASLVRSYRIMNGNEGATYDNEGKATGTVVVAWPDAHTKTEKTLDNDGKLLVEETCLLNDAGQIDTVINRRHENGKRSQTFYQHLDFSAEGDLKRSVTWSLPDEAQKHTTEWKVLERDSYGNVLKMQSSVDGDNQWITEYRYTYYGTAGEREALAREKMLEPDAAHPYAGHYEQQGNGRNASMTLFTNGRFTLSIIDWDGPRANVQQEWRGRYKVLNDQLILEEDQRDSNAFFLFGRHNPALPAGGQLVCFSCQGKPDHVFFAKGATPAGLSFYGLRDLVNRESSHWHLKELTTGPGEKLWLHNTGQPHLLYILPATGKDNEWCILPNRPAMAYGDRHLGIMPKEATITKEKELMLWRAGIRLKPSGRIVLADIAERMQPLAPARFYRNGAEYRRVQPEKVKISTAVKPAPDADKNAVADDDMRLESASPR